jgi:hypothetical protein
MTNGITRHREKRRHWQAWAGTLKDVARLSESLQRLVSARLDGLLAERDFHTSTLENSNRGELNVAERLDEDLKLRLVNEFQLKVGYGDIDDVAIGAPDEIIKEIDTRSVTLLTIFAETETSSQFSEKVQLDFGPDGVALETGSSDRGWVNQVLAAVTEEVEKGVPRWAWVRRRGGRSAFLALVLISLAFIISLIAAKHIPRRSEGSFLGLTAVSVVLLWFIFTGQQLTNRFIDWLFPAFQMLPEGGRPAGTRRLAFIGSLLLTICLGVVVNLIT